jgi:hypothetical protein
MLSKTHTTLAVPKMDTQKARDGKVFSLSLKGIPSLGVQRKAHLQQAARSHKNRDYPTIKL